MSTSHHINHLNHALKEVAPSPVVGATLGAAGSSVIVLHGAGVTVGAVVAAVQAIGVSATIGAIGTALAPAIPVVAFCTLLGAAYGSHNSEKKTR